ncbi:hypothetical protein B0H13DRAFT_1044392, partial [Mycena leptocephala]
LLFLSSHFHPLVSRRLGSPYTCGCVGPPSSATINIVLDRLGGLNPSRSWASRILLHSISVLSWLLYALWHWLARLRVLFAVASLLLILASAASMSPNSHPPRVWI